MNEARLGASRLDESSCDADPLLVLTETALERYGLPTRLSKEERLAGASPTATRPSSSSSAPNGS
jgi:hypothetical protein